MNKVFPWNVNIIKSYYKSFLNFYFKKNINEIFIKRNNCEKY